MRGGRETPQYPGLRVFLKSLTLKGFKSFADTTSLEFEPGITVVVGPNGSGKSNLVDAVAWVLGAQGPRTLRSTKMEDVIFAGTGKRPALGRAEVSLTIDNSAGLLPIEFAEVTITRTLWRSGESEYALNGVPCRLLHVQELLSDTGRGRPPPRRPGRRAQRPAPPPGGKGDRRPGDQAAIVAAHPGRSGPGGGVGARGPGPPRCRRAGGRGGDDGGVGLGGPGPGGRGREAGGPEGAGSGPGRGAGRAAAAGGARPAGLGGPGRGRQPGSRRGPAGGRPGAGRGGPGRTGAEGPRPGDGGGRSECRAGGLRGRGRGR